MKVEPKVLIAKLNPVCRRGFEGAAQLCVSHTNYDVEVEHLFRAILNLEETDIHLVLRHFDVEESKLTAELTKSIDGFKRGNTRTPAFSPHIPRLLELAWSVSSLHFRSDQIRSVALLLAALSDPALRGTLQDSAPSLLGIPRESLEKNAKELVRYSAESGRTSSSLEADLPTSTPRTDSTTGKPVEAAPLDPDNALDPEPGLDPDSALERFTVDLTGLARAGGIDPIRGRDAEIRQIVDILMRRRQNNPILTGEPGVGKTAIVEGFAIRIASGDVPEPLKNASVRALDLGLLQAGAGVRGEFEQRLKSVIAEVGGSLHPVILFIDEAHTIIGAGGPEGQGDAANLLKPALARGELRTIAATTWSEYKKYVEKDPALARRFQVIKVDEPSAEEAREMLRGMVGHLERHHGVRILEEAIRDAVDLSHRHISGRQLPDKAVSVLDTACARVAIGKSAPPVQLDDAVREAEQVTLELDALEREQRSGGDHGDRIAHLKRALERAQQSEEKFRTRWEEERSLVEEIDETHALLGGHRRTEKDGDDAEVADMDVATVTERLAELNARLEEAQGEDPLVPTCVNSSVVASVISGWTGIPVGKMVKDEIRTVISLRNRMEDRVIGQPEALEVLCRRIGTSSANLEDPNKPTGVFLLVGPSGVGKTETARTLAEFLYGGERNLVTVNMSEYQEAHTVSSLKGAPPGYVGFGTGGVLTEAVRRRPYSVVLLDEVEKAHSDVMELFYQVFDRGQMEDGEGQGIDFRHTLIVLTSNVGADTITQACRDSEQRPTTEELIELLGPELRSYFPAALLGRLVTVPYYPLGDEQIVDIIELKLAEIQKRVWEQHNADLTYEPGIVKIIADRCTEVDTGARNIDYILSDTMLPELSLRVLEQMAERRPLTAVHVRLGDNGQFEYDLDSQDAHAS